MNTTFHGFLCILVALLSSCGPTVDTGPDEAGSGVSETGPDTGPPAIRCGAVEPCTDEAGEETLAGQCAEQHPGLDSPLACDLEEATPSGCADLLAPAPLLCSDGAYLRVVCCPDEGL